MLARHVMFFAGAFGEAVAARFVRNGGMAQLALLTADPRALEEAVGDAAIVSVAAWRPYADAMRALDDLCHRRGARLSSAELHGQRLTIGPLSIPGAAGNGCYHCYLKRWSTHHPAPEREMVLAEAYARDPLLGPPGHLAPLVDIAAAALREDALAPDAAAGRLRVVDVLTGSVLQSRVIGVHRCTRCRPGAAGARTGARFVDHLAPHLATVLA